MAAFVAGKKVWCERMVMSQLSGGTQGWPPGVSSRLHTGKNSRANHSKVKAGLSKEIHTPQRESGPSQKAGVAPGPRVILQSENGPETWGSFFGLSISYASKWEDYTRYFGEGVMMSRNWATVHFLAFYGLPWNINNLRYADHPYGRK